MNRTSIEYVNFTWSPITGCLGPGGVPGKPKRCWFCAAHRLAKGRLKPLYLSNQNLAPGCDSADPFAPRFWRDRLEQPLKRKKSAKILVTFMGDLFHPYVPLSWLWSVFEMCMQAKQHTFLFLTKCPASYRLRRFLPILDGWPDNFWLGTSISNQQEWEERWSELQRVPAKIRYVSFEPLLGEIDCKPPVLDSRLDLWPDWAIIGGLTRDSAVYPPSLEILQPLIDILDELSIPIFMKDNVGALNIMNLGLREFRREYPEV